jgi:hypothetical protein
LSNCTGVGKQFSAGRQLNQQKLGAQDGQKQTEFLICLMVLSRNARNKLSEYFYQKIFENNTY